MRSTHTHYLRHALRVLVILAMIAAVLAAVPVAAEYVPDASTVLLDPFEGSTQGENHGSITYAASLPRLDQAIELGAGDWIKYSIPSWYLYWEPTLHEGTVETWVRPSAYNASLGAFQWNNANSPPPAGYIGGMFLDADGHLLFTSWPGHATPAPVSASVIPLDEWTHVAATWGPAGTSLFVNGVLDGFSSANWAPGFKYATTYVYLNGWGSSELGGVDEFRISNVARSEAELLAYVLEHTTDGDGVPPEVEDGAPNGGDGNNDGIPDRLQDNVASLPNAVDGRYLVIESPESTQLANVTAVANPSPGPLLPDVIFPVGFVGFEVHGLATGAAADVTVTVPEVDLDDYYRYGPTPADPSDHWYRWDYDGQTGATVAFDPDSSTWTLHFVDGARGDNDLGANGIIVDPGGPGLVPNDPPVAADDAYTTDEDSVLDVAAPGVLANDTDIDGDVLTAVLVDDVDNGTLALASDGSFTYEPDPDFNGTDTFTYTAADDGTVDSNVATVTITVNPVDDPTVANDDSYTTDEDTTLIVEAPGLLANDYDVDGGALYTALVVAPLHGELGGLSATGYGSFTYYPHSDYHGADSFVYGVSEFGGTGVSVAAVTITVNPVNDAPVAGDDEAATLEDYGQTVPAEWLFANDVDIDGDPLTSVLVDEPSHGTVTVFPDGWFTYYPDPDYHGPDSFTYVVNDGTVDSNVATVSMTVNPNYDPPVANDDAYVIDEDATLTVAAPGILANDTDIDGDVLTAVLVADVANGTLTLASDGSFTYVPDPDFNGTDSFTYNADDGTIYTDEATVTITVGAVNDPPLATDDVYTTDEDTTLTVDGAAPASVLALWRLDEGSGDVAYDTAGRIDHDMTISGASWVFGRGGAALEFDGTDDYVAAATLDSLTNAVSVEAWVAPAEAAPGVNQFVMINGDGSGGGWNVLLAVRDNFAQFDVFTQHHGIERHTSTIEVTPDAWNHLAGVFDGANGTVDMYVNGQPAGTWTDAGSTLVQYLQYPLTIGAMHYYTGDWLQEFEGTIDEVAVYDAVLTAEQVLDRYEAGHGILENDVDIDDDPLTAVLVDDVAHGTLVLAANGSFTYNPEADYHGPDSFTYVANDGTTDSNVATVSITVNPDYDPPVAADDTYVTDEDTDLVVVAPGVLANDTDIDGDVLSALLVDHVTHGTLSLASDGSFTYQPDPDFNGTDSFTYAADDGTIYTDEATVTITVNPVNDPPVAHDQTVTTDEDVAIGIDLTASDIDSLILSLESLGDPAHGTLSNDLPGDVTYTPDPHWNGTDSFTFTFADDGGLVSEPATVTIIVTPVQDPPVAVDDSYVTDEDTTLVVEAPGLLLNDVDFDGDPLLTVLEGDPQHGTLTLSDDGSFTYVPDPDYYGPDSFTYGVLDVGGWGYSIAWVDISVRAVNDPPVAVDDAYITDEDVLLVVDAPGLLANDYDIEGDAVTVSASGEPGNGTVTVLEDGSFTYQPDPDSNGIDTFTYQITDSAAVDTATVTIVVNSVNDPPVADANGPYTGDEGSALTLDATGSWDIDDGIVAYEWDLDEDGAYDDAFGELIPNVFDDDGTYTVAVRVTDAAGASDVAMATVEVANVAPTVELSGAATVAEGVLYTLDVGPAVDPGSDTVTDYIVHWGDGASNTYADAGTKTHVYEDGEAVHTIVVDAVDEDGTYLGLDSLAVLVTNVAPDLAVDVATQTVQYSDPIAPVAITALDVVADPLTLTSTWSVDSGAFTAGLPAALAITADGCAMADGFDTCVWSLSGVVDVPAGTYTVRVSLDDGDGGVSTVDTALVVTVEDAAVAFPDDNPVSVQVAAPGGSSGLFDLTVLVTETEPDEPLDAAAAGDIALADVSVSLAAVGPGSGAGPIGPCGTTLTGAGYDGVLAVTCEFDGVEVNTYTVTVTVDGGFYAADAEDVLVVFDPSLGFTTGGGTFTWPGTDDKTNFGYTMKYNKKGKNIQGSFLLIRHVGDDMKYRVKSNALYGLALGDGDGLGWASFAGKSTYLEPGWEESIGNHEFVVYVEDHGEPGKGVDRIWLEMHDKDGDVIPALSMDREAVDHAVTIGGGNIVVPH